MIRLITLLTLLGSSHAVFAQANSSSLDIGAIEEMNENEASVKDQYSCAKKKYASSTADVAKLFKEVLGIDGVRAGKYFLENDGYSGNRVVLKVKNTKSFQMQLVRSNGGDLPATLCWRTGKGGRPELVAAIDATSLGGSRYSVTITNPKGLKNQVHMSGSGQLNRLLNFDYTLTNAVR